MYNRQVWLLQRKETRLKLEKQTGLFDTIRLWLVQSTNPATVKSKTSLTRGRITKKQAHARTTASVLLQSQVVATPPRLGAGA